MWAGSAITFHAPLQVGAEVERTSRILSITEKTGSSGTLVFVEVEHTLSADGADAVREVQTLVYRAAAAPDAPLTPSPAAPDSRFDPGNWHHHRRVVPDPRLLFRYSALTFNTHRIHYDQPYAQGVERYRGLVVHGPLIATLLLQLISERTNGRSLASFAFTGLSPAICGEPLHLVLREEENGALALGAFAEDGRQVTRATGQLD
jgi:3-methylfumaryl-CoA hydratase